MKTTHPLQIGITGGIGSGKSLVCRIFQSLGTPVYDADSRAKELMATDVGLIDNIKKELGVEAYYGDGRINREYIARLVFGNDQKREKLNSLVHPKVKTDYDLWLGNHLASAYVLREAALIFEAGIWKDLDKVIVVSAPEELRLKRVLGRDAHRTAENVKDIFKSQMPEAEKLKRADYIIANDETRMVLPQVIALHEQFVNKK